MKKIKLTGKLALNKETIARLNNKQMGAIYGGTGSNADGTCTEQSNADGDCSDTSADATCPADSAATIKGYTCCAGSWNHSSCGGHVCGGDPFVTLECIPNPA